MDKIKEFFSKKVPFVVNLKGIETNKTIFFRPYENGAFLVSDKERAIAVFNSAESIKKALNMIPNFKVVDIEPVEERGIEI